MRRMPDVTVLYIEDCPNWTTAEQRAKDALRAVGQERAEVRVRMVNSPAEAERLGFRGSPTVLVNGRDPFASDDSPAGLSCRVYETPHGLAGAPTVEQLVEVMTRRAQ